MRRTAASEAVDLGGPGTFFVQHPVLYAVSLLGAAGASLLFASRATRSSGPRRSGWTALALLEAALVAGMMNARDDARKRRTRRNSKRSSDREGG